MLFVLNNHQDYKAMLFFAKFSFKIRNLNELRERKTLIKTRWKMSFFFRFEVPVEKRVSLNGFKN